MTDPSDLKARLRAHERRMGRDPDKLPEHLGGDPERAALGSFAERAETARRAGRPLFLSHNEYLDLCMVCPPEHIVELSSNPPRFRGVQVVATNEDLR